MALVLMSWVWNSTQSRPQGWATRCIMKGVARRDGHCAHGTCSQVPLRPLCVQLMSPRELGLAVSKDHLLLCPHQLPAPEHTTSSWKPLLLPASRLLNAPSAGTSRPQPCNAPQGCGAESSSPENGEPEPPSLYSPTKPAGPPAGVAPTTAGTSTQGALQLSPSLAEHLQGCVTPGGPSPSFSPQAAGSLPADFSIPQS